MVHLLSKKVLIQDEKTKSEDDFMMKQDVNVELHDGIVNCLCND